MSKKKARGEASYRNEEQVLEMVPELLMACGFERVRTRRVGQVKIVDADDVNGKTLRFWLKLGWSGSQNYSAIQFGLFAGRAGERLTNKRFLRFVSDRIRAVINVGASYALLVHLGGDGIIENWVALNIEDVEIAYRDQLQRWPSRARNTRSATLWFEDRRKVAGADCVTTVLSRQVDLVELSNGNANPTGGSRRRRSQSPAVQRLTVEIERRMKQQAFRLALGKYFGWKCAVSGTRVKETLDAAHLPGRDWRKHNEVSDGMLLRSDLHRLLDANLARIDKGKFWIERGARIGEYANLHNTTLEVGAKSDATNSGKNEA